MPHQERLGQQRGDEVAGDELAGCRRGRSSDRRRRPRRCRCRRRSAITRSVMSRRFSSMSGLASWFGNVPSTSKHSRVVRQGKLIEQARRDQPGDAAAAVEHDVERLDDRRIDERHHVLDVAVHDVALASTVPGVAAGGGMRAGEDHLLHLLDARLAAERKRLAPHQLAAVVLLGIVRRGDLRAAVEPVGGDGEVHHVGAGQAVVDDVAALRARAVDEGRGQRRRRQPHVARDGEAPRPEIGAQTRGRAGGTSSSVTSAG